jgi:hypothetical protein
MGMGFGLLVIGAVLPFIMVIHLLESTLFLNLVSVFAQVSGITMGLLGITHHGQFGRRK